jgi:hypothetical protein
MEDRRHPREPGIGAIGIGLIVQERHSFKAGMNDQCLDFLRFKPFVNRSGNALQMIGKH